MLDGMLRQSTPWSVGLPCCLAPCLRVAPSLLMQCGVALGGLAHRCEPRGAGVAGLHALATDYLKLWTCAGAAAAKASEPGSSGWHARAAPSRCMLRSTEQAGPGCRIQGS